MGVSQDFHVKRFICRITKLMKEKVAYAGQFIQQFVCGLYWIYLELMLSVRVCYITHRSPSHSAKNDSMGRSELQDCKPQAKDRM